MGIYLFLGPSPISTASTLTVVDGSSQVRLNPMQAPHPVGHEAITSGSCHKAPKKTRTKSEQFVLGMNCIFSALLRTQMHQSETNILIISIKHINIIVNNILGQSNGNYLLCRKE